MAKEKAVKGCVPFKAHEVCSKIDSMGYLVRTLIEKRDEIKKNKLLFLDFSLHLISIALRQQSLLLHVYIAENYQPRRLHYERAVFEKCDWLDKRCSGFLRKKSITHVNV